MVNRERPEHPEEPTEHAEEPTKPAEDQPERPMRPRLPHIGEKPTASRGKRAKRTLWVGMAVSGAIFATGAVGFRLLQHYEPGPKPVPVQPTAIESLADLAIAKGFPEECLQPLFMDPTDDGTTPPDPNVEKIACIYRGHPDGQPEPADACVVTLERNAWSDPYNFGFTVTTSDGKSIILGKGSQFSEIPTKEGVPSACDQENITYP